MQFIHPILENQVSTHFQKSELLLNECVFIFSGLPECPSDTGNFTMKYEKVCDEFVLCSDGIRSEKPCESGTIFNDITKACEIPSKEVCNQHSISCQLCSEFSFDAAEMCKSNPSQLNIQNPGDCRKFYQCIFGDITEMQCPENTIWDVGIEMCNHPSIEVCATHPFACYPCLLLASTTTAKPTTEIAPFGSIQHCASSSNDYTTRDPKDCLKYLECESGTITSKDCPTGLLWDEDLVRCNGPVDTTCEAASNFSYESSCTLCADTTTSESPSFAQEDFQEIGFLRMDANDYGWTD